MRDKVFILLLIFLGFRYSYGQNPDDKTDYLITINTEYGKIKLILFDDTPLHKENFIRLAQAGVYDYVIFHRVIQEPIQAEILPQHINVRGALGAPRLGDDVNPERKSSSTQFYIVQNCNGAHHLDGKFTVFGQVMSGFEVVDSIAAQPTSSKDRPLKNIRITVDIDQVSRADIEKFYNFTY